MKAPTNQAVTFIKPHAVSSPAAVAHVLDVFRRHGIAVVERRSVPAADMAAGGLIDRHYANNARFGTADNAQSLTLRDAAKDVFRTAFDEEWDAVVREGRVFSGEAMRRRLGNLSGEALNALWARHGARKLCGGCYVSRFEPENCYVVNGFYPSIREQFTRPGAAVELFLVAFELPWRTFRSDVIGSTNPAAAEEQSIRGYLHDHAGEFGLRIDARDNVIHASASPFEALCEARIWMPARSLSRDPLWRLIHRKAGLPAPALAARLEHWHATNPMATLAGRTEPLLDLLEDLDTPAAAAALLDVLASPGDAAAP